MRASCWRDCQRIHTKRNAKCLNLYRSRWGRIWTELGFMLYGNIWMMVVLHSFYLISSLYFQCLVNHTIQDYLWVSKPTCTLHKQLSAPIFPWGAEISSMPTFGVKLSFCLQPLLSWSDLSCLFYHLKMSDTALHRDPTNRNPSSLFVDVANTPVNAFISWLDFSRQQYFCKP